MFSGLRGEKESIFQVSIFYFLVKSFMGYGFMSNHRHKTLKFERKPYESRCIEAVIIQKKILRH